MSNFKSLISGLPGFVLAALLLAAAAPASASAQPYTAVRTGNVIELKDARSEMVVPVVGAVTALPLFKIGVWIERTAFQATVQKRAWSRK